MNAAGPTEIMPFRLEMPFTAFEKASAEPGKRRRIGGIASLESRDRQGEVILQRGLNFDDFLRNGWFNDNHSKATADVVGYPEAYHYFRKGDRLPTGEMASADGHWVEGYLLEDYEPADKIWNLARSLAKTNRQLGFSVEGKVIRRLAKAKTIAEALVRNVAVTNCPVHSGARMGILAKSLQAVEALGPTELERALGIGDAGPESPEGPKTGMDAGRVLTRESLEGRRRRDLDDEDEEDRDREAKKSLTTDQAVALVRARLASASEDQARRLVELTRSLKVRNRL